MEKAQTDTGVDSAASSTENKMKEHKDPIWKRVWAKTGLTLPLCMLMFKEACGPVIALSLFQLTSFAEYYTSIGYLVAIVTILSFPIMPRAKFLQTMFFNILGICIGACINLLTCYSAVKARQHTTPPQSATSGGPTPGATTAPYNSSASAVSGIFLFFNVMFANAIRFKLPQFQSTIIIYSISANISAIYAPQFPTMDAAEVFVKKLVLAFLGGFGIASVVSLLIFPMTSRRIVKGHLGSYLGALKQVMAAERDYLQSMETGDFMKKSTGEAGKEDESPVSAATKKLKTSITGLTVLHGKLAQDLPFAKREIAWGKLDGKELDRIFKLLRLVLLPCLGIGSVADIFERVAEGRGWNEKVDRDTDADQLSTQQSMDSVEREKEEWNEVMRSLHEPFQELVEAMSESLTHVSYSLELTKRPSSNIGGTSGKGKSNVSSSNGVEDIEAKAGAAPRPGDKNFGAQLEIRIKTFSEKNKETLTNFCAAKGLGDINLHMGEDTDAGQPSGKERKQLYMILYTEFLLWSTAKAVLELVRYADATVASGKMKRSKLILPGTKRLKKWLSNCFVPEDSSNEHTPDSTEAGISNMELPNAFRKRRHPEHMDPTNSWQRFGELLRKISGAFETKEMAFGFRVACATMSVAIMAYLKQTQVFFIQERIFWAQIMVAISMSITSGSGVFAFGLRILGTLAASILSLVIWYIAGGRGIPGAVLPILFLEYLPQAYGLLTVPRYTTVFMVMMITQVLILGYELEADKLGPGVLATNGQAYHPIYILAWIRLATVVAGLAIAFFWTYVPYPLTAKNAMRKRLSDSLYLLASYYSCVHATIGLRIEGCGGDPEKKGTHAHKLRKMRFKIVPKMLALLTEIRQHLVFTKYEFEIGGCFPKAHYEALVTEVNNIFNYMSLIDYATATYATARRPDGQYAVPKEHEDGLLAAMQPVQTVQTAQTIPDSSRGPDMQNAAWLHDLARVRRTLNLTTEGITSLLAMLSSAVSNAQPLPPFLRPPQAYLLTQRMRAIDPEILSVRHVTEPGYAAFATTQVASRLISSDLAKVLDHVRALVGEVDFSYHPADEDAMRMGEAALNKREKSE